MKFLDPPQTGKGVVLGTFPGFDGADVICVATGLRGDSDNPKTGPVIQTWLLRADSQPVSARREGKDVSVCGTCPLRAGNGCYVQVWSAPSAVFGALQSGSYPFWDGSLEPFVGRWIRWGSYGDPVILPLWLIAEISAVAEGRLGYTHAWRDHPDYREWLMASVDNLAERDEAKAQGWRTYRIRALGAPLERGEFRCPSSAEARHARTCQECGACDGTNPGDRRPDPVIFTHGATARRIPLLLLKGPGE